MSALVQRPPSPSTDVTFGRATRVRLRIALWSAVALLAALTACLVRATTMIPAVDQDPATYATGLSLAALVSCLSAVVDRDGFAPSAFGAKVSALSLVAGSAGVAALAPTPMGADVMARWCMDLSVATFLLGLYVGRSAWRRPWPRVAPILHERVQSRMRAGRRTR